MLVCICPKGSLLLTPLKQLSASITWGTSFWLNCFENRRDASSSFLLLCRTRLPKRRRLHQTSRISNNFGYENFDGTEAYSTSKLCNLLFMNELLRRYPDGPECIAYTPGVTPDTGLARHGGSDIDAVAAYMNKIGMPVSTAAYSGAFMARLCVEDWTAAGWKNGMFINVDKPREASAQSNDLALASELWEKSEELLIRKLGA